MCTKVHHLWTKKVFSSVLSGEIRIRSELKLSEPFTEIKCVLLKRLSVGIKLLLRVC